MNYRETLKNLRIGYDSNKDPKERDWEAMGPLKRTGIRFRRMIINIRLLIGR